MDSNGYPEISVGAMLPEMTLFGQAKISNFESAGTLFCLKAKARPLAAMQL